MQQGVKSTTRFRFARKKQLGRGRLEPPVEETVASSAPDRLLAEAAHPAGAGKEGGGYVRRPARAQVRRALYHGEGRVVGAASS